MVFLPVPLLHLFVFILDMILKVQLWSLIAPLLGQSSHKTNICVEVRVVSNQLLLLKLHGCTDLVTPSIKHVMIHVLLPALSLLVGLFLVHLLGIVGRCSLLKI